MTYKAPLTLGIEEEYMIVDPQSRELISYNVPLLEDSKAIDGLNLMSELLQCQVETATGICQNISEARQEISWIRRTVAELAERHGLVIAGVGLHSFSRWAEQQVSPYERYQFFEETVGIIAKTTMASSMHVHVGIGNSPEALDLMIDIHNQMRYVLPYILALSTSSPFWEGHVTGLKSYRHTILLQPPLDRMPPVFESYADYANYVAMMGKIGGLETGGLDATMLWWYVRPRPTLGTLEIRIADMCTSVDETIGIAALIQTIVAYFIKLRERGESWQLFPNHLISSNIWRAQRHGIAGNMIDFEREQEVDTHAMIREFLSMLEETAHELGTVHELRHIETILENGTSADRQLAVYRQFLAAGHSEEEALVEVVDHLIAESNSGHDYNRDSLRIETAQGFPQVER